MLEDVLDVLFYIAYADGVLHPAEQQFFEIVAEILKLMKVISNAFRRIMMVVWWTLIPCWVSVAMQKMRRKRPVCCGA